MRRFQWRQRREGGALRECEGWTGIGIGITGSKERIELGLRADKEKATDEGIRGRGEEGGGTRRDSAKTTR